MVDRAELAAAHLDLLLEAVARTLERELDGQAARNLALTAAAIPEGVARRHLARLGGGDEALAALERTSEELVEESQLRQLALRAGVTLPFDELASTLGLDAFDLDALLWCAAAEVGRSYQILLAYVQDDWNATLPTLGFLSADPDLTARLNRRAHLAPHGRLRRMGLLEPHGSAPTDLGQQWRVAPGVFDFLCGRSRRSAGQFHDPGALAAPPDLCGVEPRALPAIQMYADALTSDRVHALAIWGPNDSYRDEIVWTLASAARATLRTLPPRDSSKLDATTVAAALQLAAELDAWFWLDLDRLEEAALLEPSASWLAPMIAAAPGRVLMTGARPWRPLPILESGRYLEWELESLTADARIASWQRMLPAAAPNLADRYHLSGRELRSVARLTATRLLVDTRAPVADSVQRACAIVTRKRSAQFATFVKPKRGPESLILHPALHRQVLEVADFFLSGPQVYERWNLGSRITGRCGMRALFAGDPGTGKSLAAEVIAFRVGGGSGGGLPLMKVDLARVVSKWVGETEKSLDLLFNEAEESHAVLFLDECDALTGKRGEIRNGSDKFANLETAYLLQRLEHFGGLAILATNLRDQMDEAFQRRFQAVVHFPRPAIEERRRIWRLAFPPEAPLSPSIDLDALAALDMTGAGIVSAACTAALLAATARATTIDLPHLTEGIARQFQRESKILDHRELTLLDGARV